MKRQESSHRASNSENEEEPNEHERNEKRSMGIEPRMLWGAGVWKRGGKTGNRQKREKSGRKRFKLRGSKYQEWQRELRRQCW